MKKLIFLVFLVLALTGFSLNVEPSWSGSATLTWGVDLDDWTTGFVNEASGSVKIVFLDADAEKEGEGIIRGWIKLSDAELVLTDSAVAGAAPDVEAKLIMGPAWIKLEPDMVFDDAPNVETDGLINEYSSPGFVLGIAFGGLSAELHAVSDGEFTEDYAVGGTLDAVLGPLSFGVYGVTGWADDGYGGKAVLSIGPLDLTAGADFQDELYEVAGEIEYNLTSKSAIALNASYSEDLDMELSFVEHEDKGAIPNLAVDTYVSFLNLADLEAGLEASYDFNGVKPGFALTFIDELDTNVYLVLDVVPMTTFTLDWISTENIFTFATKIKY